MNNERDTHFANFARLLWEEMARWQEPMQSTTHLRCDLKREQSDAIELLIARRAYDLAYSFIENSYAHKGTFVGEIHESVKMLPDMEAFPEVQS